MNCLSFYGRCTHKDMHANMGEYMYTKFAFDRMCVCVYFFLIFCLIHLQYTPFCNDAKALNVIKSWNKQENWRKQPHQVEWRETKRDKDRENVSIPEECERDRDINKHKHTKRTEIRSRRNALHCIQYTQALKNKSDAVFHPRFRFVYIWMCGKKSLVSRFSVECDIIWNLPA